LTQAAKGIEATKNPEFITESVTLLYAITEGVDLVESLIRDRLADVQVVNSIGL
jgi:hypothetical protein